VNTSPVNVQSLEVGATSGVATGIADFTFGGDLQVDETGQFPASAAVFGTVALNGDVLNNGLISLADGASGDQLSFGSNLTGSPATSRPSAAQIQFMVGETAVRAKELSWRSKAAKSSAKASRCRILLGCRKDTYGY